MLLWRKEGLNNEDKKINDSVDSNNVLLLMSSIQWLWVEISNNEDKERNKIVATVETIDCVVKDFAVCGLKF